MTFADSVNDHYYFKDKQDIISIHTAIQHLSHPGGGSDMDTAFSEARRLFSSAEGGRSLVTRLLVIATDADFICKLKYKISSDSLFTKFAPDQTARVHEQKTSQQNHLIIQFILRIQFQTNIQIVDSILISDTALSFNRVKVNQLQRERRWETSKDKIPFSKFVYTWKVIA